MKLTPYGIFTVVLVNFITSCGKSSSTTGVNLKLKVAATSRSLPAGLEAGLRNTQNESRSFTPTSLKLPVMKISISKSDYTDEQILYKCPHATEAECLVDLQSQAALDAIAATASGVSVKAGTYANVALNTCVDGSGGGTATTAKLTGSGTGPNNSVWTTNATSTVVTNGTGTAEEVSVGNWSCSAKNVIVRGGIVVGTGALNLTVVVDNYLAANFGNTVSSGMGGCKLAAVGTNGFCLTYPALMAYVGTGTATTKRFTIAHNSGGAPTASQANALIIVAVASDGTPLMAYGRTLFTATSELAASNTKLSSTANANYTLAVGGPTYVTETNYASFTTATNGTVSFEQGGSSDTFAAKFAAFDPRATHTATVKSKDDVDTWNYLATLLP